MLRISRRTWSSDKLFATKEKQDIHKQETEHMRESQTAVGYKMW